MAYTVDRAFAHKTHGDIGSCKLVVDDNGRWLLDGKELPESSIEYLLTFSLQSLQDAYAGAKDAAEAVGAFEGKRDKLIEGTIGVRSGGGGVPERVAVARSLVKKAFKAADSTTKADIEKFAALSDDEQNAKLDAWYSANAAAFDPAIDEEIERRRNAADAKRKLAKSVSFGM